MIFKKLSPAALERLKYAMEVVFVHDDQSDPQGRIRFREDKHHAWDSLQVPSTLSDWKETGVKAAVFELPFPRTNKVWWTILSLIQPGDTLELDWKADQGDHPVDDTEYHSDIVYLKVHRPTGYDETSTHLYTFILHVFTVTAGGESEKCRMIRPSL